MTSPRRAARHRLAQRANWNARAAGVPLRRRRSRSADEPADPGARDPLLGAALWRPTVRTDLRLWVDERAACEAFARPRLRSRFLSFAQRVRDLKRVRNSADRR